jgi:hypothetical protein
MGQTADEIVNDIDRTRESLRANLEELESRAKEAADWRHHYRKHPGAMIAAAVLGGVVLSALFGKR